MLAGRVTGQAYGAGMDEEHAEVRLSVELDVQVVDPGALLRAAEAVVMQAEFSGCDGGTPDQERQEHLELVRASVAEAVLWCIDELLMIEDVPGVEAVGSTAAASALGLDAADARWKSAQPDVAALFPADDEHSVLTPRSALALWAMLTTLADYGYDDVEEHGDDPVDPDGDWMLFDRYPRVTWRQDAVWRRQAGRAFDDLAEDLAQGREPLPRCPGEEMALHVALRQLPAAVDDHWWGPDLFDGLPEADGDLDVHAMLSGLFQDHDILALFDATLDGIEDPDDPANAGTGMGDYRPQAWFRTFDGSEPRDGRRPFRR